MENLRGKGDTSIPPHLALFLCSIFVKTYFIEPGSPWENGYVESFSGKLRAELLDREVICTLTEAKVLIERWRKEHNPGRFHSWLGYRQPLPVAALVLSRSIGTLQ